MSLGRIIRNKREELNFTLEDVASRSKFSKPYLSTIETGKVKNPPSDELLTRLERILQFESGQLLHIAHMQRLPCDIRHKYEHTEAENEKWRHFIKNIIRGKSPTDDLDTLLADNKLDLDQRHNPLKPGRFVPVINKVTAGYPTDFDDLDYPVGIADDYVRSPDINDPNAFAVRVVGDSMEPRFSEGDIVIFSPAAEVNSADDCFVRFSDPHEATFKRVFFEPENKLRLQPLNEKYPPAIVEGTRINGLYRAVAKYQNL